MRSEVKHEQSEPAERKYPYLGSGLVNKNLIIMFTARKIGVVVASGGGYPAGEWKETWDEAMFTRFTGSVTLSND